MPNSFPPHVEPVHARHGSYSPRYGWLLKTHLALADDSQLFAAADAPVTLGVGSSAVAAMRFWSSAFKLTHATPRGPGMASEVTPTERARWLLDEDGADPYLEDAGSLWLLHWWLLIPPCRVPVWFYAFCLSPFSRFQRGDLRDAVLRAAAATGWRRPSADMVRRDVDCLVRMYTQGRVTPDQPRATFDDLLDRPFSELGLLSADQDGILFHNAAGNSAPDAVLAYTCLEYASRVQPAPGSITLDRLNADSAGPGRVLRVQPTALRRALEATAGLHPELDLVENGDGRTVLTYSTAPHAVAWDVLDRHYGHVRQRLDVHPETPRPQDQPATAQAEQLAFE